ncbi:MAG: hypothetical protein M3O15_12370 [Acidobacteriota bacterium]|nr:hypothetical protein [Acidobacteriota bacterium]
MSNRDDMEALAEARLRGQLEAEGFQQALAAEEHREREDRLMRLAWGTEEPIDTGAAPLHNASHRIWYLEREVERLASFYNAVQKSRGWEVLQRLRRPFGRAW